MAENEKEKGRKRKVGLAFPARYVRLGQVDMESPGRWAILIIGALIILGLIVIALIAA